jgi:tetrathionate reductase subunit A
MSNLNKAIDQGENCKLSRRDFLKLSTLAGGAAAFLGALPHIEEVFADNLGKDYNLAHAEKMIYSVCQQCNTQCGIKVKIIDQVGPEKIGVVGKIEGNPFSPWNLVPHLDYNTPVNDAATIDGVLCPRGQAGLQTVYDPYRLIKVLKRAGKRGENKWMTIPFEQAVDEIVEGGNLFSHVPGEENNRIEGLKHLWAIRDPQVMKQMGDDVKVILAEKDPTKKQELVEKFKLDHAQYQHAMIDPDHPDLGPKNNQILYFWGRQKAGRADFVHRFFGSGLGSTNRHGHTTVCQGSLYFAGKSMSDQWNGNSWGGGSKSYWMADTASAEFVIFVGASPFEGNYGVTNRVPRIVDRMADGRLKFAVIDPRLSKIAGKAWKWMPNKPGTEAAAALAMIQWIVENHRYDVRYLSNANKAAAAADNEPTWSNACWLVKIENDRPVNFLRGSDLQMVERREQELDGQVSITFVSIDGREFQTDPFVVLDDNGQPILFDPNDAQVPVEGQVLVDSHVNGFHVKTSLQILADSANEHTLEEWAEISGLRTTDLIEVAREFTSHGKRAAVDIHRGVSQHTNGYYNVLAWYNLALLIGNYDWRGGQSWPSTFDISGGKAGEPFPLSKMNPGALTPFGISLVRHDVKYEDTTLFDGTYPAKRNWYPLASDIYQEILTSASDGYPYPIKMAFMYMASPVYSLPAGNTWIPILQDVNKIPLLVASDIVVGETSMYADYIFPDVSYLERWEFSGSHPSVTFKVQGVRQPVISPLTGTVKVYGQEMALQWEALLLALAEKLGLPNFGINGMGEGIDFTHPDDLYLRMIANLAYGEKQDGDDSVQDADANELRTFLASRLHLSQAVFDQNRWQRITGEWWPKAVTVLNRGGRFQKYEQAYQDLDLFPGANGSVPLGVRYGKQVNMYLEKTAGIKHAGTGEHLAGYATYLEPATTYDGTVLRDMQDNFDLKLITYRDVRHTKSRTPGNYWLLATLPENYILMNAVDAAARRLQDGDKVRIVSPDNLSGVWDLGNDQVKDMIGKIKVVQGMRPGVISFSLSFGHWAYGARDIQVDGKTIKGESRRGSGINANAAMRVDPFLKNTTLSDTVGGSAVFYDSMVRVEKV